MTKTKSSYDFPLYLFLEISFVATFFCLKLVNITTSFLHPAPTTMIHSSSLSPSQQGSFSHSVHWAGSQTERVEVEGNCLFHCRGLLSWLERPAALSFLSHSRLCCPETNEQMGESSDSNTSTLSPAFCCFHTTS